MLPTTLPKRRSPPSNPEVNRIEKGGRVPPFFIFTPLQRDFVPLFKDLDKTQSEGHGWGSPRLYLRRAMTQRDSKEARTAVLMLEDGTRFEGKSIGAVGTTTGEVAFNTGMYGCQRRV